MHRQSGDRGSYNLMANVMSAVLQPILTAAAAAVNALVNLGGWAWYAATWANTLVGVAIMGAAYHCSPWAMKWLKRIWRWARWAAKEGEKQLDKTLKAGNDLLEDAKKFLNAVFRFFPPLQGAVSGLIGAAQGALGGLMGLGPVAKTVMVIILVYLLLIRR